MHQSGTQFSVIFQQPIPHAAFSQEALSSNASSVSQMHSWCANRSKLAHSFIQALASKLGGNIPMTCKEHGQMALGKLRSPQDLDLPETFRLEVSNSKS